MQLLFFRLRTHQWCFLLFNVILFHALLFGADFVEEYVLQSSPTTYTDAQTLDIRERARKLDMSPVKRNASRFFHISSADACGDGDLFLLVVVSSNAENITRRDIIRRTWANMSEVQGYGLLTLFAIGIPQTQSTQEDINKEFANHRDIIQGTFLDSSKNVILKTIMIMRWVVTFCPKALFILKSDEETFVNYRSLMEYLLSLRRHAEDLYIGRVYHQVMPIRDPLSKYYVPVSLYSEKYYPDYCSTTAFVISQDVARKVFVVSMAMETSMPEDVYVGICAKKAGVVPIHSSRFSGEKHIRFNRCCYKFIFSSFGMTNEELPRAWEEINDSRHCAMLETYYGLITCKALTYLDSFAFFNLGTIHHCLSFSKECKETLDSYYSLQDKRPVHYFAKSNQRKHLYRGDKIERMKKKESFTLSPFPSASMISESFAPTRLLENGALHKPISGNKWDSERYLPVTPDKRKPVHPGLGLNLRQSSVHLSRTIHNSTSSSPSHRSLEISSKNKPPDVAMERTGKLSLLEDKRFRNKKILVEQSEKCSIPQNPLTLMSINVTKQNQTELPPLDCLNSVLLCVPEQFQFASRRHFGFPFSATIYVNGIVAARISWCCEQRYHAGFQQGKRSCFRVIGVKGGIPCYRCMVAQRYQRYRNNQKTEAMCPGRKEDLDVEDDGSEKGMTSRSVLAMSEYGSLRSDGECERDGETAISDGSPSNSDDATLKSKETPACAGGDRRKSNQPYDVGQQKIKLKSGRALSKALKTNNATQSLDSDGGDRTHKQEDSMRKTFKKKPGQRAERADNTDYSSEESAGNDENTGSKLLEKQARHWKKGSLGVDRGSIDQESGNSSDFKKDKNMRKKAKRKKVTGREARENVEVDGERFVDHVNEDVRKKKWEKERRQEKINYLEDGDVFSVTQNGAVENDNKLSTLSSGSLRNEAEILDNNPNSVKEETPILQDTGRLLRDQSQAQNSTMNDEGTAMKGGTDVMQQVSTDKEPADLKREAAPGRERKEKYAEEKLQGSNAENAERPGKKINQQPEDDKPETHLDKNNQFNKNVELAAWNQEKLALALKCAESAWSEPELSDTSEASKSEGWQESEEEKKIPAHGRMRIDEIGQLSPDQLMKTKDPVYIDAASLAERKDSGEAVGSGSAKQIKTEVSNRTKPGPAQNGGGLSETNSQAPWDVVDLSSTDWLKEGRERCHFSGNRSEAMGNEDITGENVPKQKPKGSEQNDEHQTLQVPLEMFVNPSSTIKPKESEDKQITMNNKSNFQPLDDLARTAEPDKEHHLSVQCKVETRDGSTSTEPGMCEDEGESADTEQLLGKPATKNKGEDETKFIVSPRGQQAADTLRKHVVDTVTVLKACRSVGQLILRNTGLTDDLLEMLVSTLVNNSQSEVEAINLNLNNLGPHSAQLLVELLKAKPSVKCLLLHGNGLGDEGVGILMNGLIDLFTAEKAEEARPGILGDEQPDPHKKRLQLTELDIGSNQLTSEGLKSVAAFLRLNPPLEYLGLSQNGAVDLKGWCELFDILKDNGHVSHVLLDENVLGNEGAKHLAKVLRVNCSLCKIDLDWNGIGDEGGLALGEALSSNPGRSLVHLSLDGNELSNGVKKELNTLLVDNDLRLPAPYKS
ncbi:uncharacterized protein [Heptranchias perlo]|uniref:uncharacterized protein n=1 Tax=Heptranchias perlo TaxID=212740 RepID=UPI003559EC36